MEQYDIVLKRERPQKKQLCIIDHRYLSVDVERG